MLAGGVAVPGKSAASRVEAGDWSQAGSPAWLRHDRFAPEGMCSTWVRSALKEHQGQAELPCEFPNGPFLRSKLNSSSHLRPAAPGVAPMCPPSLARGRTLPSTLCSVQHRTAHLDRWCCPGAAAAFDNTTAPLLPRRPQSMVSQRKRSGQT